MSTAAVADKTAAPSVRVVDRSEKQEQTPDFVLQSTLTPEQRKQTRALFISASDCINFDPGIPHGIGICAAICEANGITTICKDYALQHLDYDELRKIIQDNKINFVGMHAVTVASMNAYRIARCIKEVNKNCVIVMGGPHVTALKEEPLDNNVDIVFVGEADAAFAEFLSVLPYVSHDFNTPTDATSVKGQTLKDISRLKSLRGITYKDQNGTVIFTGHRPRTKCLDLVPFPARHLFKFPQKYRTPFRLAPVNSMQIITSRGCTEHCVFCFRGGFKDTITFRSPKNVLEEIKLSRHKFNVRQFDFIDEYLTYDLDHIGEVAQRMKDAKLGIHWAANNTRADSKADYEFFRFLKSTGCFRVSFGVESGNDTVLHKIGKGITTGEVRRTIDMANKAGLFVAAFFILGHHADTPETMQDTIDFAKSLPVDACQFAINTPFPGTPSYTLLERKGQIINGRTPVDGYPKTSRNWEEFKGFEYVNFFTENLQPDVVMEHYKRGYKEVNFSAAHLWKHLKKFVRTRGRYWYFYYTAGNQMVARFFNGRIFGKKL